MNESHSVIFTIPDPSISTPTWAKGFPNDRALLELVTSASICCSAHAGNDDVIRQTLSAAKTAGVVVGAHPGYRDREGFGRRDQHLPFGEVHDLIVGQFDHLKSMADNVDLEVTFMKPHGALYNQAQRDSDLAFAVVAARRRLVCYR